MVEDGVEPRRSVVARVAGLREICGYMVRIRRALVVWQVAGHAGCASQAVVVIHVTICALPRRHRMHAG